MRRTLTLTTATAILALAACTSSASPSSDAAANTAAASSPAATPSPSPTKTATPLSASQLVDKLTAAMPGTRKTIIYTAANDPNHLLGRPNQYTSDARFTDKRISASEVADATKGSVDLGGAIEVFATAGDAQARAAYIQAVTKALPSASEYNFVHGTVLIRVSHYLTPGQANAYKAFVDSLN